jgi:hypothetical protein
MDEIFTTLVPPAPKSGPEQRRQARQPASLQGRLAVGGLTPRLIGCDVLDLTDDGARVELFAPVENLPDMVSIEICGIYNRARCCWTRDREIGLSFQLGDMQALDSL